MPWRLRLSVETILRLTPAVLGSAVFSIAGLCAAHECLDQKALEDAHDAIGSSLQTLGSVYAVLLAFVVFVVWQQFNDARSFVEKEATELIDLFRTAGGLRGAACDCLRGHLRTHVDLVIAKEWPAMARNHEAEMDAAAPYIDRAWNDLHAYTPDSEGERSLFSAALARLNDLADARSQRIDSARTRLVSPLRLLLYAGAFMLVSLTWLLVCKSFALPSRRSSTSARVPLHGLTAWTEATLTVIIVARGNAMAEKVSTMDVRARIGDMLNRVALRHDEFIIERKGKPVAALVPVERLEQMRRFARQHALGFMERQKEGSGDRLSDEQAMNVALEAQRAGRRQIGKTKPRPKRSRKK